MGIRREMYKRPGKSLADKMINATRRMSIQKPIKRPRWGEGEVRLAVVLQKAGMNATHLNLLFGRQEWRHVTVARNSPQFRVFALRKKGASFEIVNRAIAPYQEMPDKRIIGMLKKEFDLPPETIVVKNVKPEQIIGFIQK